MPKIREGFYTLHSLIDEVIVGRYKGTFVALKVLEIRNVVDRIRKALPDEALERELKP